MVLTSVRLGSIGRVERSAPTVYRHPRRSLSRLRAGHLLALLVAAAVACQGLLVGSGRSVTSDAHPNGARWATSAAVQSASGGSSSTGSDDRRTATALAATDHLLAHTARRRLSGKKGGKKLQGVEYDSRGKVSHFKGDVYPTPALALALANRSYRKELILITDTRARAALQTYYQLESMGLVHALWLTHSHTACDTAEQLHAVRLRQLHKQRGAGGGSGGGVASVEGRKKRSLADAGGTASGVVEDSVRRRPAADEGLWFAGGGALVQGSGASATGATTAVAASTPTSISSSTAEAGNPSPSPASAALTITTSGAVAGADSTAVAAGTAAMSSAVDGDFLGCAWYSQPFPAGFGGHRRLMMKRIMLLARAVRLGYSVLSLDTDVIVYRNPYPYLKSPPYSSMHMVVGKSVVGVVVNTGVVYVQGAARHGPVAWLLAEVVDRNLRWIEHNVSMPHMAQALGGGGAAGSGAAGGAVARLVPQHADSRGCWDQYLFADVLLTGMLNKLVLMYCARPPSDKGAPKKETTWNDRHRAALGLSGNGSPKNLMATMDTDAKSDPQLRQLVGADKYETTWLNLSIPHAPPPLLPDEPGYALPGAQRGRTAETFQQVLAADDKHSELRKSRARALQQQQQQQQGEGQGQRPAVERLAYAADWLVGGWSQRGAQGYWDPDLTKGKPKQVFAHLVRAPGPTHIGKDAVRMLYGQYDWSVARLTSGGVAPFLGWSNPASLPKVVALSPDVDTSTISNHQWSNMARGLVQVALLTGRMVVWPEVPCAGGWVQPNPGARKGLPLNTNAKFVTRGPFGEGLRCTPVSTFHQKCLYERHVVHRVGAENGTVQGRGGVAAAAAAAAALAASSSAEDVGAALAAGAMGWDTESGAELGEYVSRVEGPRGMLWPEFRELLRLLQLGRDMNSVLPEAAAVRAAARGSALHDPLPGPHNTVSLAANDDYDEGERPIMFDEPPRTPGVTYVRASDALKALSAYSEHHVLYLAQRTFLTQLDKAADAELMARYRAFRGECPALK